MGVIELDGIFKAKNKTAEQWASDNPILRDGELGHEKDTHKSKIGDGVNHWNDLKYDNDILLGTNILNGSHANWVAAKLNASGFDATDNMIYLDHTLIRGKQITYRVELKGEAAQAPQLGFEIKVHFTDNTDQWIARYLAGDIPERGTFEKAYTFSSQIQDKEIEYARLYPVFRSLGEGEVSGKLYMRHEFVGVGNKLPSTWSPSVADLQVTAPVTISDFKNLPSVVTSAADGVIIPIIAPVSASNGPAGLSSAGPAYGHVQVAKTGSTKVYNFLVQMDGSGATTVYSGFLHSTAQTISWTELGGGRGDDIIVIPEGTQVNDMDYYPIPRDQGAIIPIVIKAGAESAPPGGYEYVGTVQYIYGGTLPEMMINVCVAESDMIARNEWYQAHIDTEGISDWVKMGGSSGSSPPFDGPIPGYESIYSDTVDGLILLNGFTGATINFDKGISKVALMKGWIMVAAHIASESGSTRTIVVPVPLAIVKPALSEGVVFEYMTQSVASGSDVARVKLFMGSWISDESYYITGCKLRLQGTNVSPSLQYRLMIDVIYLKSSGGGQ